MKAKIFTAILALGLGITGVAATVQAAGNEAWSCGCASPKIETDTDVDYEEANSQHHWKYTTVVIKCKNCGEHTSDFDIEYEAHNLSGYSNGHFYCVDCGYEE